MSHAPIPKKDWNVIDTEYVWVLVNDLIDSREAGEEPGKWGREKAREFLDWLSANGVDKIRGWPAKATRLAPAEPAPGETDTAAPAKRRAPMTDKLRTSAGLTLAIERDMNAVQQKTLDISDAFERILAEFRTEAPEVDAPTEAVLYSRSRALYGFDVAFGGVCESLFGVKTTRSLGEDGSETLIGSGASSAVVASILMMKALRKVGWGMMKDANPTGWKKTELVGGAEFASEALAEARRVAKKMKK